MLGLRSKRYKKIWWSPKAKTILNKWNYLYDDAWCIYLSLFTLFTYFLCNSLLTAEGSVNILIQTILSFYPDSRHHLYTFLVICKHHLFKFTSAFYSTLNVQVRESDCTFINSWQKLVFCFLFFSISGK